MGVQSVGQTIPLNKRDTLEPATALDHILLRRLYGTRAGIPCYIALVTAATRYCLRPIPHTLVRSAL